MGKILDLFDAALSEKSGPEIEHILLAGHTNSQRAVSLYAGKIDSVEIADEIKIGVWLRTKGRWGCATLEQVEAEALDRAIQQAVLAAEFSDPDPDYSLAPPEEVATHYEPDAAILELGMGDFEEIAHQMEQQAQDTSPLIKNIPRIGCGSSSRSHVIANSEGVRIIERNNFLKAGLSVMACGPDERMVNCYEINYFPDRASFDPQGTVAEVAEEAVARVEPRGVKNGTWPVIFDARTAAQLLSTFSSCFSGDALYRKLTRLEGKLGQQIASEMVSVAQKSLIGLVRHAYDAEGTPCQDKYLIHQGRFETFLNNRYTAKRNQMESTGNADGAIGEAPGVAPTNFYWDADGVPVTNLYEEMGTGILIKELHGASASPISGDFSYGGLGYWVENGKIDHPIADFTIAGNFFDLLKNIIGLGDDLRFVSPHASGSCGGRSLFVKSLAVSGK